jgi:hypothetical protein
VPDADWSSTGIRNDLTGDQSVVRAHTVRAMADRPATCYADMFALPTPASGFSGVAPTAVESTTRHVAPEPDTRRAPAPHPPRAPPAV